MFIGRERELTKLSELYQTNGFQFPVIYGRRRVGKTALINEFIKEKEAIFFTGIESSAQQNLENFSRSIASYTGTELENTVFPSFQAALESVFELAEKKKIILVIDEYPYVAKVSENFDSALQLLIDKNKDNSNLFLLICGSSVAFMEQNVLAADAPLSGRSTAQFKIPPFDFFESRRFFKNFSDMDMATVYGIVGGIPHYLLQIDDNLSIEENIKRCLLDPSSPLFEEPDNIIKRGGRDTALYNAVLTAMATGSKRMSRIASRVGERTSVCADYIEDLILFDIVKKETPFAESFIRKTIYRIDDNLFRFWYWFVPDNIVSINRGLTDDVYKKIPPMLNDYMGDVFVKICIQYMWKLQEQGKIKTKFTDLGYWWGQHIRGKWAAEIDFMAADGAKSVLFCDCQWTDEKVDVEVLNSFIENSFRFYYKKKCQHKKMQFYLFAKNGFAEECIEKAKELGNVTLVTFDEMLKV